MTASSVVERFLTAMAGHDWDAMAGCLSEEVERIGPYGDVYRGKTAYVRFVAGLLPTLLAYQMKVHRILDGSDGHTATAELSETVAIDERTIVTEEGLVFDVDTDGLIRRIAVYIQRPL